MEKNFKNFIITVVNTVDMFEEAKKALLTNDAWMTCVITQISNRLPKENTKKHLANVVNNIANYARNNFLIGMHLRHVKEMTLISTLLDNYVTPEHVYKLLLIRY